MPRSILPGLKPEHVLKAPADLDAGISTGPCLRAQSRRIRSGSRIVSSAVVRSGELRPT